MTSGVYIYAQKEMGTNKLKGNIRSMKASNLSSFIH